jgi:hypothetical protein
MTDFRNEEVSGSIPLSSTIEINPINKNLRQ